MRWHLLAGCAVLCGITGGGACGLFAINSAADPFGLATCSIVFICCCVGFGMGFGAVANFGAGSNLALAIYVSN